ncbi:hypothetical protein FHT44_005204 [Mycolicibacterium sp. BK634]|uniref:hypothetical protein n=1 Tax=Mycolicibacterium sp. BK634 TaxID=2587099 RepID=UPI00161C002B|nr:hypothetical protein [Mycolicibacterium sp. BK634]MBB3752692.1 hypothetical protein [Mycolicibacterium sp. BK634]
MSDIQTLLQRAKDSLAGTTPGPWDVAEEIDGMRAGRRTVVKATIETSNPYTRTRRVVTVDQTRPHWDEGDRTPELGSAEANVAFIAEARTLIPELVEALEYVIADRNRYHAMWRAVLSDFQALRGF